MTEETEQDIAKRIHKISTQIENLKATQFEAESLTTIIKSEHARVRGLSDYTERKLQNPQDEHSLKQLYDHCRTFYATLTRVEEQLVYWETRFTQLVKSVKDCEHECCGYSEQLVNYYRHELNRRAVKLNEREYEYKAVVKNLEKVNAECEVWKEKYNVTKKLLDAETSAEHTGSDRYNELYKENQQLYAALDEKEDQIDGLFKEAKLLTETKASLVSELLDLKYLIHKLRLDDETPEDVINADDTEETKS